MSVTANVDGFRYSPDVAQELAEQYGIDNPETLVREAIARKVDDGDKVLNTDELIAAAKLIANMEQHDVLHRGGLLAPLERSFSTTFGGKPADPRNPPELAADIQAEYMLLAGESAAAAVKNPVHDVANIAQGLGQVAHGLWEMLTHSIQSRMAERSANGIANDIRNYAKTVGREGDLTGHQRLQVEKMMIAAAHLDHVEQKDLPEVREGLRRIGTGAACTVVDVASMPFHLAQAVLCLEGAGLVAIGRGMNAAARSIGEGLGRLRSRVGQAWESTAASATRLAHATGDAAHAGEQRLLLGIGSATAAISQGALERAGNLAPTVDSAQLAGQLRAPTLLV